ncbi:MAG: pyruvate formate lyase family protein, partial [Christensenellales bacterium]
MNERIARIKAHYVTEKKHRAARQGDIVCPDAYRAPELPDHRRTALRLKAALAAEIPVIEPFERIVFTRTVSSAPRIFTDAEWADITERHFIHELGNVSNVSPDYGRLIRTGLLAARDALGDTAHDESARIEIDAILELTARYAAHARARGMEAVARTLDRVPAHGARDLGEALQSLRILHYAMWCEGNYHNTLGRFDQYMLPYAKGVSDEEALEWIEEFFLACNRDSDLYPGMQQGDNGQSLVVGGMLPDGTDGYNKLSELSLIASANLKVIDPKLNLRVDKNTPPSVYELGTRLTKLGLGFPQYCNDDVVIPGLERLGYRAADARNYVVAACWEFIIPGRGADIANIGAVPIAAVADRAIREAANAKSMDEVLSRASEILRETVQTIARGVNDLYMIPSPY